MIGTTKISRFPAAKFCCRKTEAMDQKENKLSAKSFSQASLDGARIVPGRKTNCSRTVAGWSSLLVQSYEVSSTVEYFENAASPDQVIVLMTKGVCEIESFSGGAWKKDVYRPGVGGLTVARKVDRLRWRAESAEPHGVLHIHVPQFFFAAAGDEYRRAGTAFRGGALDALAFIDPTVFQTGIALNRAVSTGAPNLYAESAAQFLAVHLLSMRRGLPEPSAGARNPGAITDRRLRRVLEFMRHHYAENLTLAELAREAGVSRFHFVTLFKNACGATPHQYLIKLRMNAAAALLEDLDLSVKEIAFRCGYADKSRFSAAFRAHFSQAPAEYRKNHSGSEN